jgi:hypothetical protein
MLECFVAHEISGSVWLCARFLPPGWEARLHGRQGCPPLRCFAQARRSCESVWRSLTQWQPPPARSERESEKPISTARTSVGDNAPKGRDGLLPGGCRNDVFCLPRLKVVVRFNNLRPSVCHAVNARPLSARRNPGLAFADHSHRTPGNAF